MLVLRFLLILLLISSGVRIVTANGLFMFKAGIDNVFLTDEEDGKDKAEKKQTKQLKDDHFLAHYRVHFKSLDINTGCRAPVRPVESYRSFFDQPNTPPPDCI